MQGERLRGPTERSEEEAQGEARHHGHGDVGCVHKRELDHGRSYSGNADPGIEWLILDNNV
jgi:hypothetical protein